MSKYIDANMVRSGVTELLQKKPDTRRQILYGGLAELMDALPAADVAPVRHGKWIKLDMHAGMEQYKCSCCRTACYVPECMGEPLYHYCPECGAEMDVENDGTSKDADPLIAKGYAYTERFPFDGQPPKVMDVLRRREE